jgi:hypothetical protein
VTFQEIEAERLALNARQTAETISREDYNHWHALLDSVEHMNFRLRDAEALTDAQEAVIDELREEVESQRTAMERWREAADEYAKKIDNLRR